ncbi:histidinol-phosphatase [Pararhizobium haloflavum]|uniref:histidinol-phosphatase n=1 Tax=Pararhizobium haloflavum TaxID=2037914 RepID=UPI000C17E636|nr:histidinol-phosphatase [Pararhizobium haloflavum]
MIPDTAFLVRLADAAARETLPRFRTGTAVTNKLSGGFDPVTEADRAAESVIRTMIAETYPDHGILGEEHGSEGADRDHVWVIDPIDGTRAFISGLPVWGTLVGFYQEGRAMMGVMDQPFIGERFVADGTKARYRGPAGESVLAVRDCQNLANATLFTTSPKIFAGDRIEAYEEVERAVTLARYGCDCYAYSLLAGGHIDIVIESGLKAYDIGALIPIIEQAGGIVTTWDGGRPEAGGDIIACGSAAVHGEALELLKR